MKCSECTLSYTTVHPWDGCTYVVCAATGRHFMLAGYVPLAPIPWERDLGRDDPECFNDGDD